MPPEPALVLPWAEGLPLAWDLGRGSYVQGHHFLGELCNEPKPKLSEIIFYTEQACTGGACPRLTLEISALWS